MVSQDDFALPESKLPIHPTYKVSDWDVPRAYDWQRFVARLRQVREGHEITADDVRVSEDDAISWSEEERSKLSLWTETLRKSASNVDNDVQLVILDGFLILGDLDCTSEEIWNRKHSPKSEWTDTNPKSSLRLQVRRLLDIKVFLRVSREVLQKRRDTREYDTAEGTTWKDPPGYFDQVVWPAYVHCHEPLFKELESPRKDGNGIQCIDMDIQSMSHAIEIVVNQIASRLNSAKSR